MRFRPVLVRLLVGVWLGTVLAACFVGYSKALVVAYVGKLALHAIELLKVPTEFWLLIPGRVADVAAVALLFASAWCIGLALLRSFRWVDRCDTLASLFSIGLGLGVWSTWVLAAGLAGWMRPGLYLGCALLSLTLMMWHWPWVSRAWKDCRERERTPLSGYERCLILALALGFVLVLIPSLTPEVEYDALDYHLSSLSDYRKAGRIEFLPYNSLASLPSLTEMLYLWGISLRDSSVAKLIHGTFGLLIGIGLIALGKEVHSRSAGITAAALFYPLPYLTTLSETARVDLATAFYAFLAGVWLRRYLSEPTVTNQSDTETKHVPALWMASLAAGLSMATKYTGAALVLVPCLLLLLGHLRGRRLGFAFLNFLLVSALPILPWLAKNFAYTGNPVFPLAQEFFQGETQRSPPYAGPVFDSLSAWATIFKGAWDFSVKDPYASPALLLFVPLFLLLAKPGHPWKFCAWFGGLMYLFWFVFTGRQWRWFCPALPWFALLGAYAIAVLERDRITAILTRVALALTLTLNLSLSFLVSALDHSNPRRFPPVMTKLSVFLGHVSEREYLGDLFGAILWMNDHLPDDASVLYLGEIRTFYARHRTLASETSDRNRLVVLLEGASTPKEVFERMTKQNVTHIYIDWFEVNSQNRHAANFADVNWELFEFFLRSHARLLFEHGTHFVYEIVPAEGGD